MSDEDSCARICCEVAPAWAVREQRPLGGPAQHRGFGKPAETLSWQGWIQKKRGRCIATSRTARAAAGRPNPGCAYRRWPGSLGPHVPPAQPCPSLSRRTPDPRRPARSPPSPTPLQVSTRIGIALGAAEERRSVSQVPYMSMSAHVEVVTPPCRPYQPAPRARVPALQHISFFSSM